LISSPWERVFSLVFGGLDSVHRVSERFLLSPTDAVSIKSEGLKSCEVC